MALCYDNIVSNYSTTEVFGPGTHFIGVARQFVRIKQAPTMVRLDSKTYTSDYFRLDFKLIVTYQLPTTDFTSVDNFYINFGDNSEQIISAIINKKVASVLSEYPSTTYKNASYNAFDLESYVDTKLTNVFQYELGVPLQLQVLIESLVVEGASSSVEAIDRQVENGLL